MSTSIKLEASPNWEPEFEHISWNEIVDADLEGDLDKLQSLKYVAGHSTLYIASSNTTNVYEQ